VVFRTKEIGNDGLFLALGEVTSLLAQSELHQDHTIGHLGELIVPALLRGQIRIWRNNSGPVGFASWAFLDAETEAAVLYHDHQLREDEWDCGPRPVVVDFVAPFGDGFRMARDLSRTVFPNRAVTSVRRDSAGNVVRIVQHPGRDETGAKVGARILATAA